MVIKTDASLLEWGARCTNIQTGGLWLDEERMMHINCLELLAGAFAVNALMKSSKDDNTTAVSYIDKMEGTHSHTLAKMACSLWQWCLGRGIVLSAEHLPGSQNVIAERESWTFHSSAEWQLHKMVFQNSNPTKSVPSRSFCHTFKSPTSPVCELAARPISRGYGCIPSTVDKPGRLCLSFLFPGRQVPTESETGAKYPDRCSPGLAAID